MQYIVEIYMLLKKNFLNDYLQIVITIYKYFVRYKNEYLI